MTDTTTPTPTITNKQRAINRLKSFYPFRQLEQQSYVHAIEDSKEGKPIAWAMSNIWQGDLPLRAMGIKIVFPENYASVCAARGSVDSFLDLSDAEGYPPNLCGYSKCSLGYSYLMMKELGGKIPPDSPMGGIPKPDLLLTSGLKCDTRSKWFQALAKYFNAPEVCLELPTMGPLEGTEPDLEAYQIKYWVTEIRDYISFVEKLFNRKMDWAKLEELIDITVKMHNNNWQIDQLCKTVPGPRHSVDHWGTFFPAIFTCEDMNLALKLYQDMLAEVKERVNNKVSAINYPEKFRLIFSELPPWHSLQFFDDLAERGWNFVYESYLYHLPLPPDLTNISDPIEKLARLSRNFYYNWLPVAKKNGISNHNVDFYLRAAKEYKSDGFFLHYLNSCRPLSQHLLTLKDFAQKKLDIPSLWVEGDMVNKRVFDPQEVLARAEAFEQTMDHYRMIRKNKGQYQVT